MINGNLKEFIDGLYYGDERVFVYHNIKYFIQGFFEEEQYKLMLDIWEPKSSNTSYIWEKGDKNGYPVEKFLKEKLFEGKTFLDIEQDIEWVDS